MKRNLIDGTLINLATNYIKLSLPLSWLFTVNNFHGDAWE